MSAYSRARDRALAGKILVKVDATLAVDHYKFAIDLAERKGFAHFKEVQKWRDALDEITASLPRSKHGRLEP